MGRSDYSLGKIQLIYWIPRSLQNFWKCHHDGCVLYFITPVRLVLLSLSASCCALVITVKHGELHKVDIKTMIVISQLFYIICRENIQLLELLLQNMSMVLKRRTEVESYPNYGTH